MHSNIKAVLFDADDTLFSVKGTYASHYLRALKKHGHDYSEPELERIIGQTWFDFKSEYISSKSGYKTSAEQEKFFWLNFVRAVCSKAGIDPSAQACEEVYQEFGRAESRVLKPYALETLKEIKESNLITGVLSNHDQRLNTVLKDLRLAEYLDHIFLSAELGYKKPSVECFEFVMQAIKLKPEEILFIGNSYETDYLGAKSVGWNFALISHDNNHDKVEHKLNCLSEILGLFKK